MTEKELLKKLYDLDIEKAVLGCLLSDPNLLLEKNIRKEWFYDKLHRVVYETILQLYIDEKEIDILKLKSKIDDDFLIQDILESNFVLDNFEDYVDILVKKYVLRTFSLDIPKIISSKIETLDTAAEVLDFAHSKVNRLFDNYLQLNKIKSLGEVGIDVMKQIKQFRLSSTDPFKITTDLEDFNKLVPGFMGGDMVVIAGRPASGKTSFMMQLARYNAERGYPVGIVSLEMKKEVLFIRQLSYETGIPFSRIMRGELTEYEWEEMTVIWKRLNELPIYVDDTSRMTDLELKTLVRKMKDDYGIEAVFIDYIQLLDSAKRTESRQQEITNVSRSILSIAKEMDIPVFVLSQLSRDVEKRENKRPRLSDLRESGSIEQDATHVIMLYNPSSYGILQFDDGISADGVIELIVAKYRNGAIGNAKVAFLKEKMRFANLYKEDMEVA